MMYFLQIFAISSFNNLSYQTNTANQAPVEKYTSQLLADNDLGYLLIASLW